MRWILFAVIAFALFKNEHRVSAALPSLFRTPETLSGIVAVLEEATRKL